MIDFPLAKDVKSKSDEIFKVCQEKEIEETLEYFKNEIEKASSLGFDHTVIYQIDNDILNKRFPKFLYSNATYYEEYLKNFGYSFKYDPTAYRITYRGNMIVIGWKFPK